MRLEERLDAAGRRVASSLVAVEEIGGAIARGRDRHFKKGIAAKLVSCHQHGEEAAGFVFAGRATQRDALMALGIREATARADTPIEQLRALGRRSAIDTLLDPNGFGAFEFVCFAKDAPSDGLRMFAARAASEVRYP